jgi:hypothetical protein
MALPTLNDDQRLYLQTIFDYFHEHGRWPTYRYVDHKLTQISRVLDIEKIAKSLPGGFASTSSYNLRLEDEAILSISAIYLCAGSEEELTDFIKTIIFCVERYFSSKVDTTTVQISSDDLSKQLGMSESTVRKVGLLIVKDYDYHIYDQFGCKDNECYNWELTLSRRIREFDGVRSIEQYLEKLNQLKKVLATPIPRLSELGVGEGTILSSNQYNIVQGDQYNISGNEGEVKVKSPSIDVATKNGHRNPWVSGSFYLIVFIIVVVALSVAGQVLSIYALPIVVIGGLLALSIIGALQLRQDERLSEENFLKLMALSFKYFPWFKRRDVEIDKNSSS